MLPVIKVSRDLTKELTGDQLLDRESFKQIESFKSLLEQMTTLDSTKRITCNEAARHSFIIDTL